MQLTAYVLLISDWSSDVCSSDLRFRSLLAAFRQSLTSCDGVGGSDHSARPSSPRPARLAISAPIPIVQGAACFEVTTWLTSVPSRGVAIDTRSPLLWVKPSPGPSPTWAGANRTAAGRGGKACGRTCGYRGLRE